MRYGISLLLLLFALSVGSASLDAQGRGKGQTNRPTTAGAKQGGASADHAKPTTPKGPNSTAPKGPKSTPTQTAVVTAHTPTTNHVNNPKLEARLQPLLPAGMTVQDASRDFRNWGQFVAAVHVSNNLRLDFNALKAAMTGIPVGSPAGTTPTNTPMSLGQAVQSLKGTAPEGSTLTSSKIKNEVKRAEGAANEDLRRTRDRS